MTPSIRPIRRALRVSGFVTVTAVMLPAFLARKRLATPSTTRDVQDRWVKTWSRALLGIFGIDLEIIGDVPPADGEGGRLVVANHRSAIDVGLLLRVFGGRMVSRGDLATWPLLGAAAKSVGTVFVYRSNVQSGVGAIRVVESLLRERGTVHVFAEGTTFADDEVRPFHPGTFVAAKAAAASIIPVGIAYATGSGAAFVGETFTRHLSRMAATKRARVVLVIGDPIAARDAKNAKDLTAKTHAAVSALVARARERVDRI